MWTEAMALEDKTREPAYPVIWKAAGDTAAGESLPEDVAEWLMP